MTIDDYSHYIWTLFLGAKEDALDKFRISGRSLEKPTCALIQANHGNRFEHRVQFGEFCEQHEFHITSQILVLLKPMRSSKGRTKSYK